MDFSVMQWKPKRWCTNGRSIATGCLKSTATLATTCCRTFTATRTAITPSPQPTTPRSAGNCSSNYWPGYSNRSQSSHLLFKTSRNGVNLLKSVVKYFWLEWSEYWFNLISKLFVKFVCLSWLVPCYENSAWLNKWDHFRNWMPRLNGEESCLAGDDGSIAEDCRFVPDAEGQTATSSLMSFYWIDSVRSKSIPAAPPPDRADWFIGLFHEMLPWIAM